MRVALTARQLAPLLLASSSFRLSPQPFLQTAAVARAPFPPRAVAAPLGGELAQPSEGPLDLLYDGQCMVRVLCILRGRALSHTPSRSQVCLTNKALLSFFDRRAVKRINFINIREPDYNPSKHGGVAYEDAMRHIHVIGDDGSVIEGSEAVLVAYSRVGLGWFMRVLRLPIIRWLIDGLYAVVSRHRYTISKFLPGGAALAGAVSSVKDLESAAMGEGCDDEEECMLDYGDDDDDVEIDPRLKA